MACGLLFHGITTVEQAMFLLLLLVAVLVGGLIGTVGVGGILLIPALNVLAGLSTHTAMGTALFSFIFTGLLGTWLFWRHGSIDCASPFPSVWAACSAAIPVPLPMRRLRPVCWTCCSGP